MTDPNIDPALTDRLARLADLANRIGAQGIWLIRGAMAARLSYIAADQVEPLNIPGVESSMAVTIDLHLADAGVLVVMRFPAGDGGEPGIESR